MTKDCISKLVSTDAFVWHFEVLKFFFISKYQRKLDFSWCDPFKTPAFTMVDFYSISDYVYSLHHSIEIWYATKLHLLLLINQHDGVDGL